jgi:hypothetical protein
VHKVQKEIKETPVNLDLRAQQDLWDQSDRKELQVQQALQALQVQQALQDLKEQIQLFLAHRDQ